MALTLNDEQEAALRQWWSRYGDGTGYGQRTLHEAVAPMMKPWRYYIGTKALGCSGIVEGPNGQRIHCGSDEARSLCDLLNESEARR